MVLASLAALAVGASACGSDVAPEAPPRLVTPTPERLEKLAGAHAAADVGRAPGADATGSSGARGAATDQYPRGAVDFTSAAQFEAYITECEAFEPHTEAVKTEDVVYRGTRPEPGVAMPADNIFRWQEIAPEFIDPNKVGEAAGTNIVMNLFETLVLTAPGNSPPVPGAAESWEMSADGLVYTFHLRPGMVWSDGHPVTAHDFEYSWKRELSPELASKAAGNLWFLKGGKAYNEGKVKSADAVGVTAKDDLTLVVTLESPTSFFLPLLTYTAYAPVPRWAIEKWGDRWTDVEHIVTNGAFRLAKWIDRDRMELERSPTYWDKAHVALAGSIVYFTESESKNEALYASGQGHVAYPLSPDSVRRFIKDGRDDLVIGSDGCIYYYVLRTDRPPFDDARVRRAFNLGLDKEALTRSVLGLFQKVATTLTPDMIGGFTGYLPPHGPDFNPVMARELLADAGYPNGIGLDLEISYNTLEGHRKIAEFVASDWGQRLGVRANSANMEWKSLLKKQQSGDFQVSRAGWCPDYPDPLTFLAVFHSSSGDNYPAYKNPAYDAMLDRIQREIDPHHRNVLMCAAEKGLMRDMPIVPMYQYTRSRLIRHEVKGLLPQYQDRHLLKWVSLEGQGGH
ncbi:MAG: peptide ABC transporter substrate-binding protein [Myxococcota bacterium]